MGSHRFWVVAAVPSRAPGGGGYLFDLMGSYDLAWKIGVMVGLIAGTLQLLMNDRPTERVLAAEAAAD